MKSRTLFLGIFAVITGIVFYTFFGNSSEKAYLEEIARERKDKDDFMKSGEGSPIENRNTFTGLHYFEPDLRFRFTANLTPIEKKEVVTLATSDGLEQRYQTYAWADFDLDDRHCRLLLLEVMDPGPMRGTLFLAFADATSADETYGAGRYLDVKKVPGAGTITLDFNKAYNPYCAYSDSFSCPFPPKENLLKVPIMAGEKNYK